MSGPITTAFSFGPLGAVIVAAEALREARAMGEEYETVAENMRKRRAALSAERRRTAHARIDRVKEQAQKAGALEQRLERLRGLCSAVAAHAEEASGELNLATFSRPNAEDDGAMLQYAQVVQEEIDRAEALLARYAARFGAAQRDGVEAAWKGGDANLDDVLHAYALLRADGAGLSPEQVESFRATVARILGRLELPTGESVPAGLDALAREILAAPSVGRAEELAAELRLRVQTVQDERRARLREMQDAEELLRLLPEEAPDALRMALEGAAAGETGLDGALREGVETARRVAEAARQRAEQEAAAVVLEASLRDLGYEVEDVASTLFVEGGVVHFQRRDWGDYFVRLRLDPLERNLNFNVVRSGMLEDSGERRRLDVLAEDRWCSEFPRLMQTLAARGLRLEVTRRLDAGALPVQAVDAASLPRFGEEKEADSGRIKPLQRGLI